MTGFRKFVKAMDSILITAIAVAILFFVSTNRIDAQGIVSLLTFKNQVILYSVCTSVIILNIIIFLHFLRIGIYDTHVTNETEEGHFSVSISAIEETLTRSISSLPEIADVRLRVYKYRGKSESPVKIYVRCSVWDTLYSKDLPEKIRAVIQQRFNDILDLPSAPEYTVKVEKLVEKSGRKQDPKKAKKPEDEFSRMFQGPEYPIDKD